MSKLNKLRRLSLDEIRVRGAQSLNSLLERSGWSSLAKQPADKELLELLEPRLKSGDELLEYFRARTTPSFFAGLSDREATVQTLHARWPNAHHEIVGKAERVRAGRFDLLGLRELSFGEPIDWQLEPITRKQAPLEHWSRVNYLDAEVTGDKKIIWELNRHQYFVTLGQAYWLTGDERYADTFVSHLTSWMDRNPPKLGINWASSLEIAFRSISWLWALHFFKDSAALDSSLLLRSLKLLYLQARHLETYLSTYFSPNTHLTGEALGLFYLGTILPEFRAAPRWRETGRRILLEQLATHVRPDGVYFEQSSYYHRYTTDFYIHFLILAGLNNQAAAGAVEDKLQLLLDHLMYITRPDGTTPLFGDDDGGRLVMLDQRAGNDFRATLATGAVLFARGDYKNVAATAAEETLWLLGPEGLAEFDRVSAHEPAAQSKAFETSGYYVMRDDWTPAANYLLVDCGPHGTDNCGHAHADALSFELAARGKTLLVDPGTYTYTGSKEMRDWFRGSTAHNTLTVDGQSSSQPDGPFSWSSIALCQTLSWITRERFDYFAGQNNGYERLVRPLKHSRAILFLKHNYWVMRDRVCSESLHRCDLWFHPDAGILAGSSAVENEVELIEAGGPTRLRIACFGANSSWQEEKRSVSHCYAEKVSAPVFAFSTPAGGNEDFVTFLIPATRSEPDVEIREVEAIGGRAFEIHSAAMHDILMIKTAGRAEMALLASDFDWTWARFAANDATIPEEMILIGGHRLELEGREVLRSELRLDFLAATRVGEQFLIETDDGVLQLPLPIILGGEKVRAKG